MIYKLIAAALLVSSGEALKINAGMSRRAVAAKAASFAVPLAATPAFAELKRAADAEIYKRADEGKLNAARAIERAKNDDLVNGSSATCDELDKLIAVDREAVEFEKEKIQAMTELKLNDPKGLKIVEDTEKKLQAQIDKLKKIRAKKGCASDEAKLKQASDFEVYKRADEGTLNSARVIARAREGKLVDGSGATCEELDSIIFVDQKAIKFEKDKLEAMGGGDAAEKKAVADAEKAIEAQVKKLEGLMKTKKCKIAS